MCEGNQILISLFSYGFEVGDSVLVETLDSDFFALVTSVKASHAEGVKFRVRRYYRPEETVGGRHTFYGNKELLLTDHLDTVTPWGIFDKINVHSFLNYTKLETVGEHDYFCRFEYEIDSGWLSPSIIDVYVLHSSPLLTDLIN